MTSKNPVIYAKEIDFIREVANECYAGLSSEDRNYFWRNPRALDYFRGYAIYVRNQYIYTRDFTEAGFRVDADYLSVQIVRMVISMLIPECEYGNPLAEAMFDSPKYNALRIGYEALYGKYPDAAIPAASAKLAFEEETPFAELVKRLDSSRENPECYEKALTAMHESIQVSGRNRRKAEAARDALIEKLIEKVWRIEAIRDICASCGMNGDSMEAEMSRFRQLFREKSLCIPMEVSLLPYREALDYRTYNQCLRVAISALAGNEAAIRELDAKYFQDRDLVEALLEAGSSLQNFPAFQDDEALVRTAILHRSENIEFASDRLRKKRDLLRLAAEHTKSNTLILALECMEPCRSDEEIVQLACEANPYNFAYASEELRSNYDLAKRCLSRTVDAFSLWSSLGDNLKDCEELVMLDMQTVDSGNKGKKMNETPQ